MKTIYLWETDEGWKAFNFDASETKEELSNRGIKIGYRAKIGYDAKIGNGATIGDDATIGNNVTIGYNAKIGYDEIIIKTMFITGSRHPVIWYGKNVIHIGCKKETIDWWLSEGENAGKAEGYTEEQLKEYKQYFEMCKQLQDSM